MAKLHRTPPTPQTQERHIAEQYQLNLGTSCGLDVTKREIEFIRRLIRRLHRGNSQDINQLDLFGQPKNRGFGKYDHDPECSGEKV